jgi:hypothetical protein
MATYDYLVIQLGSLILPHHQPGQWMTSKSTTTKLPATTSTNSATSMSIMSTAVAISTTIAMLNTVKLTTSSQQASAANLSYIYYHNIAAPSATTATTKSTIHQQIQQKLY